MRRRRAVALVAALLVAIPLAAGPILAAGAAQERQVTVEGTVTGPDGAPADDAVVLLAEDGLLEKHTPTELRELAEGDPEDVTVIEVGDDGRFEATVGWKTADHAVAVGPAGTSEVVNLQGEDATLDLRLHERRPQTVYAHLGSVSAGEQRAELYLSLVNNGEAPIEGLTVALAALPDGWSVAEVRTGGSYDAENGTVTWASVAPGAEIDTTVVLSVPEGAAPGEYRVELRADSDTHLASVESETVEVLPEQTPGPTRTPDPGGDETTPAATPETPRSTDDAGPTTPERDDGEETAAPDGGDGDETAAPGFGLVAGLAALAAVAALFGRLR